MANYVLTQTGQEVQDILDSMGATYFFSQTATFASDSTYADYPYKGTISLVGVDGTMGVEVSFSNDQAISGNYSPICNTTNDAVEIWSKVNTSITIPTIKIYKNGYVNLNGSSNYMPQSGGNFTGAISVNNSPVLTESNIPNSIKPFRLASSITVFDEIPQADADWYYKSYAQTGWASAPTGWGVVFRVTANDQRWSYEIALPTVTGGIYLRMSINGQAWGAWQQIS